MSLSDITWIVEEEIAVSGQPPGLRGLMELREQGIGAVVSLTEWAQSASEFEECGLTWLHLPVRDFSVPTREQIQQCVDFVEEQRTLDNAVLLHCGSGYGRSGTMAACVLVSLGRGPDEALEEIRRLRPGSVETDEQESAIEAWADHLRSRSTESE